MSAVARSTGSLARLKRRRKFIDSIFGFVCGMAILFAIGVLIFLLFNLVRDGLPRLRPEFFTNFTSRIAENAGIKASLFGTLWVITLTAIIAIPIGVAAAIYLEEFATRKTWLSEFIRLQISNLAGVPSIVYGLLGLTLFVRWMALDRSIIAGALTMSLLILPMVIIVSQEALRAVPKSFREASLALGATQWQTIRGQVIPRAMPGILTGMILAISRAIGETAPLITIGAVTFIATTPSGVMDRFTVLPIQIFDWASRPQQAFRQDAAAAAILVLMATLIVFNLAAIIIRSRSKF